MTPHRPDLLVSATWLFLILWCAVGSIGIVITLAWLIAQAAEWIVWLFSGVVS
jgi:hypothetical protein